MRAGVDDTGSGDYHGLACIILSDTGAERLTREAREILSRSGLKRFHGKELNPDNAAEVSAYRDLVEIVKQCLQLSGGSAVFQILHREESKELIENTRRFAARVMSQVRGESTGFIDSAAWPLFWLARNLTDISHTPGESVDVELDRSDNIDTADAAKTVFVGGQVGALLKRQDEVAAMLARAYQSQVFSTGPTIRNLTVVHPSQSILTQAADVFANFGLSYIKRSVRTSGLSGLREQLRAGVFESMLPLSGRPNFQGMTVTANNDLAGPRMECPRFQLLASE